MGCDSSIPIPPPQNQHRLDVCSNCNGKGEVALWNDLDDEDNAFIICFDCKGSGLQYKKVEPTKRSL